MVCRRVPIFAFNTEAELNNIWIALPPTLANSPPCLRLAPVARTNCTLPVGTFTAINPLPTLRQTPYLPDPHASKLSNMNRAFPPDPECIQQLQTAAVYWEVPPFRLLVNPLFNRCTLKVTPCVIPAVISTPVTLRPLGRGTLSFKLL